MAPSSRTRTSARGRVVDDLRGMLGWADGLVATIGTLRGTADGLVCGLVAALEKMKSLKKNGDFGFLFGQRFSWPFPLCAGSCARQAHGEGLDTLSVGPIGTRVRWLAQIPERGIVKIGR